MRVVSILSYALPAALVLGAAGVTLGFIKPARVNVPYDITAADYRSAPYVKRAMLKLGYPTRCTVKHKRGHAYRVCIRRVR